MLREHRRTSSTRIRKGVRFGSECSFEEGHYNAQLRIREKGRWMVPPVGEKKLPSSCKF